MFTVRCFLISAVQNLTVPSHIPDLILLPSPIPVPLVTLIPVAGGEGSPLAHTQDQGPARDLARDRGQDLTTDGDHMIRGERGAITRGIERSQLASYGDRLMTMH